MGSTSYDILGDQNRAEDRYEEEACSRDEEGQYVYQSLSPDEVVEIQIHVGLPRCGGFFFAITITILLLLLQLQRSSVRFCFICCRL